MSFYLSNYELNQLNQLEQQDLIYQLSVIKFKQQMDIQYESTPPKRLRREEQFSTPDHKTIPKDSQTSKKSRICFDQTPQKQLKNMYLQTPLRRNLNPESRRVTKKKDQISSQTPCKSPAEWLRQQCEQQQQFTITPFFIPRLQAEYQFVKHLGRGNFSRVGLYRSRSTQEQFAIKITQMSLMSVVQVQAFAKLSLFSQNSKHIIKYHHSWIQDDRFYIVMEYCSGSLNQTYQQLKNQERVFREQELRQILKQALTGLRSMHEHDMVHLDIKPDNLLLKDRQVKIADLGLCRAARIKRWSDLDQRDTRYLAKQILNYHQGIDLRKADIFSLGMSIFQGAILQDLPNNGQSWLNIRQNQINLSSIPQMSYYSAQFQQLIQQMIRVNWRDRPSCEQLLNHKYFSQQQSQTLSRFMNKLEMNQTSTKDLRSL